MRGFSNLWFVLKRSTTNQLRTASVCLSRCLTPVRVMMDELMLQYSNLYGYGWPVIWMWCIYRVSYKLNHRHRSCCRRNHHHYQHHRSHHFNESDNDTGNDSDICLYGFAMGKYITINWRWWWWRTNTSLSRFWWWCFRSFLGFYLYCKIFPIISCQKFDNVDRQQEIMV